ncbi:hypothetical protein EVAR_49846_1 [Eumeta japonica]|uniref:Uncharacterized protein n=1 Tax=Eumeta variegata TaxID=151549 RepID=A0A4C1YZJ8_EUMVA|nr:hypothetical protein EVAR_49846_1 [Eumeta japonica]
MLTHSPAAPAAMAHSLCNEVALLLRSLNSWDANTRDCLTLIPSRDGEILQVHRPWMCLKSAGGRIFCSSPVLDTSETDIERGTGFELSIHHIFLRDDIPAETLHSLSRLVSHYSHDKRHPAWGTQLPFLCKTIIARSRKN